MTLKRLSFGRGQAMTEFLVLLAGVILPFLLLMPMIGKYQDVQHQTQLASRYVAFEARTQSDKDAAWKADGLLADEVRARFFADQNSGVISNPGAVAGAPNWADPTGALLIPNPATAVKIMTGRNESGTGVAGGFDKTTDAYASPAFIDNMEPRKLGLETRGVYTASVQVTLNSLPVLNGPDANGPGSWFGATYAGLDKGPWTVKSRVAVLTGPWTAKGPDEVMTQMGTRTDDVFTWPFPSQALTGEIPYTTYTTDKIDGVIQRVELGNLKGPRTGELTFWRDVAPTDRLK